MSPATAAFVEAARNLGEEKRGDVSFEQDIKWEGDDMNRALLKNCLPYLAGVSSIAVAVLSQQAIAQQAPVPPAAVQQANAGAADAANAPDSNGAIVVTARRRDENLFKVPISVAVLSGESLRTQGIRTENDLQLSVPGLLIPAGFGGNDLNYSIRGQTIDSFSGSAPAVVPYLDEVEIGGGEASTFFDFQSVQVLKGPQGTLFGRNTTGGAILFTTVQPGDKFSGSLDVLTGNFGKQQVQFGVTVPLAPIASIRIAGNYSDGGGFVKNLGYYDSVLGSKGNFIPLNDTLGDNRNKSIRGTLALTPTPWLRNTTVVQYSRNDGTSIPSVMNNYDPNSPLIGAYLSGQGGPFAGIPQYAAWQKTHFREVYSSGNWRNENKSLYVINTAKININDNIQLKNITGWNRFTKDNQGDYTGTPWSIFQNPLARPGEIDQRSAFSNEFQLQGKAMSGNLNYTLGAFYSNSRDVYGNHFIILGAIPLDNLAHLRDRSYAGFVQATYNITSQLHLTGGFRYTDDKIDLYQLPGGEFSPGGSAFLPSYQQSQAVSFKKPSWTISIDDQVTPQLLLYVTQRGSWRSGGLNFNSPPNPGTAANSGNTFLPETLKDVELGAKYNGHVGGASLTASIDVYQQWINNVQKSPNVTVNGGPVTLTVNIPKAQVHGVEATVSLRPAPWIEFGGQLSYGHSKFTSSRVNLFGNTIDFGPVSDFPDASGAAYINLTKALDDGGAIVLRSDLFAESGYYYSNTDATVTPNTKIPGYALVNARLSWNKVEGSNFDASLFAKNLFDKKYYAGGISSLLADGADVLTFGTPRTYGVEVRYSF